MHQDRYSQESDRQLGTGHAPVWGQATGTGEEEADVEARLLQGRWSGAPRGDIWRNSWKSPRVTTGVQIKLHPVFTDAPLLVTPGQNNPRPVTKLVKSVASSHHCTRQLPGACGRVTVESGTGHRARISTGGCSGTRPLVQTGQEAAGGCRAPCTASLLSAADLHLEDRGLPGRRAWDEGSD